MKFLASIVFIVAVGFASGGCGVYMAFTQPPKVDTNRLEAGAMSRDVVVERLGAPVSTIKNADGSREEVYQFYEGSSSAWKIGRGIFHLAADLFTAALWEIVATPMEYGVRGDKLTAHAEFDKNDRLTEFRIVGREEKPLERIHKQQNGSS